MDRRTFLEKAGGSGALLTVGAGVGAADDTNIGGGGLSPDTLKLTIWMGDTGYSSDWGNYIDGTLNAFADYVGNHLGVDAVTTNNFDVRLSNGGASQSDLEAAIPDDHLNENEVNLVIVDRPSLDYIGYMHSELFANGGNGGVGYVNQSIPETWGVSVGDLWLRYRVPVALHEIGHALGAEHGDGEQSPFDGERHYNPTAMATGYTMAYTDEPAPTDCSGSNWAQTYEIDQIAPDVEYSTCADKAIQQHVWGTEITSAHGWTY